MRTIGQMKIEHIKIIFCINGDHDKASVVVSYNYYRKDEGITSRWFRNRPRWDWLEPTMGGVEYGRWTEGFTCKDDRLEPRFESRSQMVVC